MTRQLIPAFTEEGLLYRRDRQAAESRPAKPGNDSRNAGLHDASSICAAACVQVIEGFTNQPVKPPRGLVIGDLAIPGSCVKLDVPSAKRRHLNRRQLLDRCFDFFDGAYGHQYTLRDHCRQTSASGLTNKLSSSQPTTSPHPRTLSRVCSNAWFWLPYYSSLLRTQSGSRRASMTAVTKTIFPVRL